MPAPVNLAIGLVVLLPLPFQAVQSAAPVPVACADVLMGELVAAAAGVALTVAMVVRVEAGLALLLLEPELEAEPLPLPLPLLLPLPLPFEPLLPFQPLLFPLLLPEVADGTYIVIVCVAGTVTVIGPPKPHSAGNEVIYVLIGRVGVYVLALPPANDVVTVAVLVSRPVEQGTT